MDIVERLRKRKAFGLNGTWMMLNEPDPDCQEAADEIDRLRRLAAIVEADTAKWGSYLGKGSYCHGGCAMPDMRAALGINGPAHSYLTRNDHGHKL